MQEHKQVAGAYVAILMENMGVRRMAIVTTGALETVQCFVAECLLILSWQLVSKQTRLHHHQMYLVVTLMSPSTRAETSMVLWANRFLSILWPSAVTYAQLRATLSLGHKRVVGASAVIRMEDTDCSRIVLVTAHAPETVHRDVADYLRILSWLLDFLHHQIASRLQQHRLT